MQPDGAKGPQSEEIEGDSRSVVANSLLLASSQGLLILTALGFWAIAKRSMPTSEYNDGLVLINAIMLVGAIAKLNGDISLPATIARRGRNATRILAKTLALTGVLAALGGLSYHLLANPIGWPQVTAGWILLPLACTAWTVFTLQDGALAGVGRADLVPIENLVYGIARLAVMVGVIKLLGSDSPGAGSAAMTIGWVAPLAVAIPIVLGYVFLYALPGALGDSADFDQDAAVVQADAAGSIFNQALFRLLPLAAYVVIDDENKIAALGTAWLVFAVSDTFLSTIGTGLAIADPAELERSTRQAAILSAASVLTMGIGFAAFAPLIMNILVPDAGHVAVALVRLIGLALVLRSPLHLVLAQARALGAAGVLFKLQAFAGVLLLGGLAYGLSTENLTTIGAVLVLAAAAVLPATWLAYRRLAANAGGQANEPAPGLGRRAGGL